jgi:ectoine hydroxylase-related dioxygenase (phytanoyl-CoA dioxygenase family)
MGRGTHDVMTAWIPYGDVSLELGGLMMLEKSHLQQKRLRNYLEMDVDTFCANRGPYKHNSGLLTSNPVSLREKLGGRWLTTAFQMGDLLTFGMKTVHGSLDNSTKSYRLSTDTRYQLASEPIDERWVGPNTEEYGEKNRIGKVC